MAPYSSPALNVMVAAARKAGRPLIRDFNELENLQISMLLSLVQVEQGDTLQ